MKFKIKFSFECLAYSFYGDTCLSSILSFLFITYNAPVTFSEHATLHFPETTFLN